MICQFCNLEAGSTNDCACTIYVDNSILSTFSICEEKGRLSYVKHYKQLEEQSSTKFGSAFHAGVATLYSLYTDWDDMSYEGALKQASLAFTKEAKDVLSITSDTEKRTIERGLNLLEYYARKWKSQDVNWSDVFYTDKETGESKPYIEVGFAVYFMTWKNHPIIYVGKIDRIRRNRLDGLLYNWETKTTSYSLKAFNLQVRPNHQITGYAWAAQELLGIKIAGTIWDAIFVSDRKIGGKYPDGVDIENDFSRIETRRSPTDINEFLIDLKLRTTRFLDLQISKQTRWIRNDKACSMFGGCHFRDACNSNLNLQIMAGKYKIERWEPWAIKTALINIPATS